MSHNLMNTDLEAKSLPIKIYLFFPPLEFL